MALEFGTAWYHNSVMKSFGGKVAAITGAGSGMGRTLALSLARQGCHLAISDVNEVGLAETAQLAAPRGVKVTSKKVDVSKRDQVYAWADEVVADHGKCNLIFNNAGVAHSATLEGTSYEDFEWIVGINFWGVVYGTKAFLPHLRASGEGHVVNLSSLFGLLSVPGNGTYNATKFAVRGFTEALREELEMTRAPVSATCIHPGGIKTNIARSARMHGSMKDLGVDDPVAAQRGFERMFRVTAEEAAETILRGVQRNARRVLIGTDAIALDALQRLLPSAYQRIVVAGARRTMARIGAKKKAHA
jgi:NAD(P)-dependent dehydrogenase (short-subunit alcohol dehydrogenase family)